jgi:tetratricopeptide (TPR) repeat protein
MFNSRCFRALTAFFVLASLVGTVSCRRGPEYYVKRGNGHFDSGRYADAAIDYRKAIQQNGQLGEAYFRLGLTDLKTGDQMEAYKMLGRAAELLPRREDVQVQFANICLAFYLNTPQRPQFLYDKLTKAAGQLSAMNPQSFDAWRIKGIIAKSDNKVDEAIADLRKANSLRPRDAGAVVPLAECLFATQQDAEGEKAVKDLLTTTKDVGIVYELLYSHYMARKSPADAEAIARLRIANNPQDVMGYYRLALHFQQSGRLADMIATLQQILDRPKDFPLGYLKVGEFYATLPDRVQALHYFREGLNRETKDKDLFLKKIAAVQMAQDDKQSAIQSLEAAIKIKPQDPESRTMHAILLLDMEDAQRLPDAHAELQKLAGENARDPLLRFSLARVLLAEGDAKAARTKLQEAVNIKNDYVPAHLALADLAGRNGSYAEVLHEADLILSFDEKNFQARILRCIALLGTGVNSQARAELLRLQREYPGSQEVQFQLALLAMNEKDFKSAEKQLKAVSAAGQTNIRVLSALTQLYMAQGQKEAAVKLLDQAVASSPPSPLLRELLANTASDAGSYDIALREFTWLTNNSPKNVTYLIGLGTVYRRQGQIPDAIAVFRRCALLAPNDPQIPSVVGFLQETNGETELAKASYRQALKADPENALALNNLAYLLADTDTDLDHALEMVQRAEGKKPNDNFFEDTLGWIYVKKKRLDLASGIFSRLTAKAPDNPIFHYHFGVALWQKGEKAKARPELERALGKGLPKQSEDKIRDLLSDKNGALLSPGAVRTAG